jgi:hypothetical protein
VAAVTSAVASNGDPIVQTSSSKRRAGLAFVFVTTLALLLGLFARQSHALQNTGGGSCVYCDCQLALPGLSSTIVCECPDSWYVGGRSCTIKEVGIMEPSQTCRVTGICSPILGGSGGTWIP